MKNDSTQSAPSAIAGLSRRREVRVGAPCNLVVSIPSITARSEVRDISYGGLSLSVSSPVRLRSIHAITLELGSITVRVRARTIHCSCQTSGDWMVGLEFMAEPSDQRAGTDDVVNAILGSAISFV